MKKKFSEEASASSPNDKANNAGAPSQHQSQNFINIDDLGLESLGYLVYNANSETVEEYRLIKRRLLRKLDQEETVYNPLSNIFLITSAMESDGKTFTSINLALSLAMEVDKTVLLIDADVLRNGASKTLGIDAEVGFIDMLEDEHIDFSELVYKTNIPNFTILPSGRARLRSTELFSSEKMKQLSEELSRRYPDRIIIIDSPPVLQTTESQALVNALQHIVFVVSSGHTPMTAIREALSLIEKEKDINFVLNKVRQSSSRKYYYGKD